MLLPMRSVNAFAAPLYGTFTILMPALSRKSSAHKDSDEPAPRDFRNRRHLANVERVVLARGLRHDDRRGDHEDGVAVGSGARQFAIGRFEEATRLVLDDDRRLEACRQLL